METALQGYAQGHETCLYKSHVEWGMGSGKRGVGQDWAGFNPLFVILPQNTLLYDMKINLHEVNFISYVYVNFILHHSMLVNELIS